MTVFVTGTSMRDALEPVRQRLWRQAQDEADSIRAAARDEARRIVEQARRDATAALDDAIAAGQSEGAGLAADELRRARDAARTAVLAAQREACDELRARVRDTIEALPGQPGYDRLSARLSQLAVAAAGPGAVLSPAPAGGVVARADGVVVDCSLDHLADLAVAALGAAVRELWEP